jgi:hypothetical protein
VGLESNLDFDRRLVRTFLHRPGPAATALAARLAESARPEIRTDRRIRAVYDFLARNIPASI